MSVVLSCLDRNLLEHVGPYVDFNVNCYLVNCAATGGSSGSPVFSKDGEVIGVLSGGTKTTNFVIPLELPISRGDVQAKFEQKPPSRCRELGLTDELAKAIRMDHHGVAALLVASGILPSGPSHGKIQEGDIIVQVDGEYITHPLRLGEILDRCVGKTLRFRPQRGASDTEVDVYVGNIYDITPDRLVHVWGATFHTVSYQQAMQNNLPVFGVCCAHLAGSWASECFERNSCIIDSIDYRPTPDLDTFIEVIKEIPDDARVTVGYKRFDLPGRARYAVISVNRELYPSVRELVGNDKTGVWDTKAIQTSCRLRPRNSRRFVAGPTSSYLVEVECSMLKGVDGHNTEHSQGCGTIIG
ncbi:PDZ-like domain-containing protein [Dactylonectria estremocensis]|uniref:PDZ-like domain-containing protein n=1 Tax=Dactylonectria estremocensis TaxID=1079267 RepID=A0A9P9DJ31_9HYPO|nr:PDZ-like domain-containing protein [Dactylonectria estremocensis]